MRAKRAREGTDPFLSHNAGTQRARADKLRPAMTSTTRTSDGWVRTACPMDCPDACSLEAKVDGDRVTALRGSAHNPMTGGFMCAKMTHYPARVNGDDRILTPLRRSGPKGEGRFEPIGWDEALTLVAAKLREVKDQHGGEAILPYHYDGSNGVFAHDWIDEALWRRLGASDLDRTLCAAPATETATAMYGKMAGVGFEDYEFAKTIVVWGGNPNVSNIHIVPHLNAARKNGAKIVVVDPRRTPVAERSDLHLAVWPGTDLALALWLIGETERRGLLARDFLREHALGADHVLAHARKWTRDLAARETRIPPADLDRFADLYLEASPALLRIGWGIERNRNGDGAMAAVLAVPAFAGKFGIRGGGYTLSNSGAYQANTSALLSAPAPAVRTVNMSQLGNALGHATKPPVKAIVVYNANPLVSTPGQTAVRRGFLRDDLFTVVIEQVMTDTCAFADVILPATTFLESHELLKGYGAMIVQRVDPVVAPRGEARSNQEIFAALAQKLGFEGPDFDTRPDSMTGRYLKSCKGLPADAAARLARDGVVPVTFDARPGPIQFVNSFPLTIDRKIHLDPSAWRSRGVDVYEYVAEGTTPQFPFALLSPATAKTINSILGDLDDAEITCAMNPDDLRNRGFASGDIIRVFNNDGEVRARAIADPGLRRGVCVIPKGVWLRNSPSRTNANALINQCVTRVSGGATYNDARVEVASLA